MHLLRVLAVVHVWRHVCLTCMSSPLQVSKERGISVQELMVSGAVTTRLAPLLWHRHMTRIAGVSRC
jgi:hypothetical protein